MFEKVARKIRWHYSCYIEVSTNLLEQALGAGLDSGGGDKGGGNVPKRIDKCQSTFFRVDPGYHPKDTTGQYVQ